jgi:hypothetical protein
MPLKAACIALLVSSVTSFAQTPKHPAKLFIEPRAKGDRNVTLELTRDLMRACPALVSITESASAAELRLAITPGATTLYRTDGTVEHIFSARFTLSGLKREICSFLQKR